MGWDGWYGSDGWVVERWKGQQSNGLVDADGVVLVLRSDQL